VIWLLGGLAIWVIVGVAWLVIFEVGVDEDTD